MFVSTGTPVSPLTGRNWEHAGVRPDVEVVAEAALARAHELALAAAVERGAGADARWTLEALRADATGLDPQALRSLEGDYGALRLEFAGEGLRLRHGRRPPQSLLPLSPGLFFFQSDPARRVRVVRNAHGEAVALELLDAGGGLARHVRGTDARR